MRHHRIARATLLIAAVFVVAALVFAGAGYRSAVDGPDIAGGLETAPAGDGAAEFEARCGRCHDRGSIAAWAQAHPGAEARAEWLATVLQKHFPPPAQERDAIIGYVQRTVGEEE